MAPSESRFVAIFAVVLLIFTSLPYLAGMQLPFSESQFDQILSFDADFHSYLAFMRQAREGQWLFHNPYTSEPHAPVLFNLEWLVFGKLARLLGGSLEAALHVERMLGIILLSTGLWRLCSLLLPGAWMRRFAFAWVLLGGGFGWVLHTPWLRRWVPEFLPYDLIAGLHPFFWMLIQPHFVLPQALSVWTLVLVLTRRWAAAALALTAAGAMRPFELMHLSAAIGLFGLLRRSRPALAVVAAPLPLWAYYLWLFRFHPVFQWWSIQNVFPPPRPALLAVSLGLSAAFYVFGAGFGLPHLRRPSGQPPRVLLACAALASLALLYSFPLLSFSLQFITTLAIPAALAGLTRLRPHWGWIGLLAVNSLSSAALWRLAVFELQQGEHRTPYDLVHAYQWLARHSDPRELVLASEVDSNRLPRYSHNPVFWGYLTTVASPRKSALFHQFFDPATSAEWRREFLLQHGFRYVLVRTHHPSPAAPFQEVFRNRTVVIYRVVP